MFRRLAILALLLSGTCAHAQVTFTSNFDSAAYTPGTLSGQDGWVVGSGTTNVPAVTTTAFNSSPQSVLLVGNPGTGSTFSTSAHPFAAGAPSASTNLLQASATIRVDSVGGADRYFGIGFGTSALATSGFMAIALGGNGLRGGGGSYASFNNLTGGLLQARTTADFLGRWITVSIVADRSITTNNVTFTFSGLDTTGGAATEVFTKSVNFGTTNLAFVQVISDWGSTNTFNGTAFVDDVSFSATGVAVPEPHQIAMMATTGLAVFATWRWYPRNRKLKGRFARKS